MLPEPSAMPREAPARVLIPPSLSPALLADYPPCARVHRLGGETMGTTWSVDAVCPGARAPTGLQEELEGALENIVAQMSTWRTGSDICRFNRAPAGTWQTLPREMFEVLEYALALAQDTRGAYDPTLGRLVDLWGFGPQRSARHEPPAAAELSAARAQTGWNALALDPARRCALQPGGMHLDFSGIAKGYAVDALAERLQALGIAHYLVEIGGELRGQGCKPDGQPWWIGIEWPESPASGLARTIAALHNMSSATSGDYRRNFVAQGRRYSHTIDPRSGWPVDRRLASVTVFHPSCMCADALATALAVLGAEEGMAYARRRDIAALFRLRSDESHQALEYEERMSATLTVYLD